MLEKILKRTDVKDFLHEVLNDIRFTSKKSQFSPNGELYIYNQYSLLVVIDSIIKFSIIIDDESYFEDYIQQLRRLLKRIDNHRDLVYGVNKLLGQIVMRILNLENMESVENKKQILAYIYDKYVVNGYYFYSCVSSMKDKLEIEGIDPLTMDIPVNKLKQINYILNNHKFNNILGIDFTENVHFLVTDSPALAYFNAICFPKYLSDICTFNSYMKGKDYDQDAFCTKDYEACRENIIKFCKKQGLSLDEGQIIIKTLTSEWNRLDLYNSKPCIVFIKRSSFDMNYLSEYRQILNGCENKDIVLSISEVMESKVISEKRYTPFTKDEIDIKVMPSYQELFEEPEEVMFKQEVPQLILNENNIEDLKDEICPNYLDKAVNEYGKATFLGLIGLLMIALGSTLLILLTYYS